MRADLAKKKKTLKTYEDILRQPAILDQETQEVAQKCKVCFKLFLTPQHLVGHYKRKHIEYYMNEIRPQEDELLKKELGEIAVKMN